MKSLKRKPNRKQTMNKFTAIENIAAFLQETKGSVLATWKGKLTAKQQREMFGVFVGKGQITINGEDETIVHSVKVCFGLDYENTVDLTWNEFTSQVEAGTLRVGRL